MTHLLPRLSRRGLRRLLDGFAETPDAIAGAESTDASGEGVWWAASGGTRASPQDLAAIREAIAKTATEHDFPSAGSRDALARFDAALSARLAVLPALCTPDALRDDVWAYIAAVIAPDVAVWRFGLEAGRFEGGIRNTFQRLWIRGRLFDRGEEMERRWGLLDALSEDALVAITERGGIAGQPRLARALAEGWVRAAHSAGRARMEPIMRRGVMAVRIANEIRLLAALPEDDLAAFIDAEFRRAEIAIRLHG
jgi:hypothetical protein